MDNQTKQLVDIEHKLFNLQYPVYFVDKYHNVLWVNNIVKSYYPDAINKKCHHIFYNNDQPCEHCLVEKTRNSGEIVIEAFEGINSFYFKNSNFISKIAIPDYIKNSFNGILCIERDVTEEKLNMEELKDEIHGLKNANENLANINLNKDIYYTNLIHQINNYVNNINQLTKRSFSKREAFDTIKELTNEMSFSLDKLLEFNKINELNLMLEIEKFNLRKLINKLLSVYSKLIKDHEINFKIFISDDIDEYYLGDQYRIKQIVSNILENAFRYTEEGFVEINVYELERHQSTAQIKISIKDSGQGISQQDMDRIFKRYNQGTHQQVDEFGVVGLGLSISKELIDLMDGDLTIDSTVGEGTTVDITIPVQLYQYNTAEKIIEQDQPKIFILDGEQKLESLYKEHLSHVFDVYFTSNGHDALAKYFNIKPDVFIVDIMTEDLNGLELFDEIEKNDRVDARKIAISNRVLSNERDYLISYGFDEYLEKPIDFEHLSEEIYRTLER